MSVFSNRCLKRLVAACFLGLWSLAGVTASDADLADTAIGWDAYIKALSSAREMIDQAILDDPLIPNGDSLYRAEGYRWVLRWAGSRQGRFWGNESNPGHPIISRCPTVVCKLGWDNPDYTYLTVGPLSPEYTYRVFGKRNDAQLMLFQIQNHGGLGGGDTHSSESLTLDSQGKWEIHLSESRPSNTVDWIAVDEQSDYLLVRTIFGDWDELEPSVQVEVVSGPDTPAPTLTPERFARHGRLLAQELPGHIRGFIHSFKTLQLHEFPRPCTGILTGCDKDNVEVGGFADILYTVARYHVPEGKALVISVPAAQAKYRNIQLGNVWTESQDYIHRQTSLNSSQDYLDEDQVYRYVLSHKDPGYANWLDISNHAYGSIMMRWIFSSPENLPKAPTATLVDARHLARHLPASHRRVSAEERHEDLKKRHRTANQRLNPAGL